MKSNIDQLSDEELLSLDVSVKRQVLEILYKRYEKLIYFKALSILKDSAEAKDLTHDIFIKVFTKLHQFQGKSRFSLWVHSISFNTCMQYLKDKKKLQLFELDESKENISDPNDAEREEVEEQELNFSHLDAVLKQLKPENRMLLIMKYMEGLSIREIADFTGLGESAVKMKLKRLRDRVAQEIKKIKARSF